MPRIFDNIKLLLLPNLLDTLSMVDPVVGTKMGLS